MKKVILTGITPSGKMTIGNYASAIKQMLELQEDKNNQLVAFSADLHAVTTSKLEPSILKKNSIEGIATYLAAGIDPKKSIIFLQSDNPNHTELAYLIMCSLTEGELDRMTQYKDKAQKFKQKNGTQMIPFGLKAYPALMAADIILYNTNLVPVGKDQKQHIELTRNIVERFNKKFKTKLIMPQDFIPKNNSAKIMSLSDPSKKMSKSDDDKFASLFLDDCNKDIEKKIKKAVTDSENKVKYDFDKKPGVSNLIQIYNVFSGMSIKEIENKYANENYGVFKIDLIKILQDKLGEIQAKKEKILSSGDIDNILEDGYKKSIAISSKTLDTIKEAMGFYKKGEK